MIPKVIIIGAGKIGRGFIGQLFYRNGYQLFFVDAVKVVVELLNKEKKYRVDIAGEIDQMEYITIKEAFTLQDTVKVWEVLEDCNIIASSVGANNIEVIVDFIKPVLQKRSPSKALNWFICENANRPALMIKNLLLNNADDAFKNFIETKLGLVETQILRTGMVAKEEVLKNEPLALRMQNWWTLPFDKDAFVGEIPKLEGFKPKSNFQNELQRKIYTFNGLNGPISYIGWANGYSILHQSALAPELSGIFKTIMEESAYGLVHQFGFDEKEQREFQQLALNKYTDPALNDLIERNARDMKRKVGKDERLVGPALLCLKHGKIPYGYAKAIAAAYSYKGSNDDATVEVLQTINDKGIEFALQHFSQIDPSNSLFDLIVDAYNNKTYLINKS